MTTRTTWLTYKLNIKQYLFNEGMDLNAIDRDSRINQTITKLFFDRQKRISLYNKLKHWEIIYLYSMYGNVVLSFYTCV